MNALHKMAKQMLLATVSVALLSVAISPLAASDGGSELIVRVNVSFDAGVGHGNLTIEMAGTAACDMRKLILARYDGFASGIKNGAIDEEELLSSESGYIRDSISSLEGIKFDNIRATDFAPLHGGASVDDFPGFIGIADAANDTTTPAAMSFSFNASKTAYTSDRGSIMDAILAPLATISSYEIGTAWNPVAPLAVASAGYAEAYEGQIYFIGEEDVQVYDPQNDDWSVLLEEGVGYQPYRGSSAIIEDRIYIVQGWSDAMYYDITNNAFVDVPDPHVTRLDYAVGALDGHVYISGGWLSGDPTPIGSTEVYDPETETWTGVANMTQARMMHGLIGVGGYLYAVAGTIGNWWPNTGSIERYDPALDAWTTMAPANNTYSELGLASDGENIVAFTTLCERYDIDENVWHTCPGIAVESDEYGYLGLAGVWCNGYVYTVGGRTAPDGWYDDVLRMRLGCVIEPANFSSQPEYEMRYRTAVALDSSSNIFYVAENETLIFEVQGQNVSLVLCNGTAAWVEIALAGHNIAIDIHDTADLDTDDDGFNDLAVTIYAVNEETGIVSIGLRQLTENIDDNEDPDVNNTIDDDTSTITDQPGLLLVIVVLMGALAVVAAIALFVIISKK